MAIADIQALLKDNPTLLAELNTLADAAGAKDAVQKANAQIVAERDELKASIKTLQEKKTDGTATSADLAVLNALKESVKTMETKIFGRLSAWQNWIFTRANATGDKGALTLYGQPERPSFHWTRT